MKMTVKNIDNEEINPIPEIKTNGKIKHKRKAIRI